MAKENGDVLVLFEDGKPESERHARMIAERLQEQGRKATVKGASCVQIPEILAASLFVLGADCQSAAAYAELARLFKGMNLAGRRAAFFGASGAAIAWLRGLCSDTELVIAHSDLVGRHESPAIAAWIKGVLAGA